MTRQTRYALNLMPFAIAMMAVLFLPKLEQFAAPVVRDFVVTNLVREPAHITVSGYMRKVRDCQFVGVQAVAARGGDSYDVPILFLDNPTASNASRPTGSQAWGPWRVTIPAINADEVRLSATHRCHPMWATDTHLVTIPLESRP